MDLNELIKDRNKFIAEIKALEVYKRNAERDIMKQVIKQNLFECVTVNYQRLERISRDPDIEF